MEFGVGLMIRDNLTLNIIMLPWPLERSKPGRAAGDICLLVVVRSC
jgi:hypothetical protein